MLSKIFSIRSILVTLHFLRTIILDVWMKCILVEILFSTFLDQFFFLREQLKIPLSSLWNLLWHSSCPLALSPLIKLSLVPFSAPHWFIPQQFLPPPSVSRAQKVQVVILLSRIKQSMRVASVGSQQLSRCHFTAVLELPRRAGASSTPTCIFCFPLHRNTRTRSETTF